MLAVSLIRNVSFVSTWSSPKSGSTAILPAAFPQGHISIKMQEARNLSQWRNSLFCLCSPFVDVPTPSFWNFILSWENFLFCFLLTFMKFHFAMQTSLFLLHNWPLWSSMFPHTKRVMEKVNELTDFPHPNLPCTICAHCMCCIFAGNLASKNTLWKEKMKLTSRHD